MKAIKKVVILMAATGTEILSLKQLRNAFSGGTSFPITFNLYSGITLYGIIDGEFKTIVFTRSENQTFNIQTCVPFILESSGGYFTYSESGSIRKINDDSDGAIFVAYGSGNINAAAPIAP